MNAPRLVVFDVGNVLVNLVSDWSHAAALAGVEPPTIPPTAAIATLSADFDLGRLDAAAFAAAVAPLLGTTPAAVLAALAVWITGPADGTADIVATLADRGVATACLSNTNALHWAQLTDPSNPRSRPLARLTHRFASHLLHLRKPDPAIFRAVESATATDPRDILFFDDSPAYTTAAIAVGWRAVTIDPARPIAAQLSAALTAHGLR